MKRLATTVAIAAWTGFLAVFSAELLVHALAPDVVASLSRAAWPPALAAQFDGIGPLLASLAPAVEIALGLFCLAIAGLFGRALALVHAARPDGPAAAERLAATALVGVAALGLATELSATPLLPIEPGSGLVWIAVALTGVAVLFDRLVAIETAEDEEAEFRAVSALARNMGRQTALYGHLEPGQGEQRS